MQNFFRAIKNPTVRLRMAWIIFILSVVLWPLSIVTFASSEPPVVLSLSWFAITLTALDIIVTSDVRKEQDENGKDKH